MIGAGHKQAIVMLVERKSGFTVLSHVTRKTSDLVSQAIITSLALLTLRVRTVTYDNGKVKSIRDYGLLGTYGLDRVYQLLFELRENQKWEN